MKIAFIGFGEAGYGLAKGLKQAGLREVYFFDKHWNSSPYGDVIMKRAAETGAILRKNIKQLLVVSDLVISCVTGSVAIDAAKSSAPFLNQNHLYVDANTASPMIKQKISNIIEKTGATFVDVAMMGAIAAFLHRVPILASGTGALRFKECMEPFEMKIDCIGDKPGQASAIKMFRSIFMKGFVALLLETLNATHRYNVDDIVLKSLAETMEKSPFLETVRLQVTKGVIHAERMAHEMEEVIKTLEGLDVPSTISRATMKKLHWCSSLGLKEHFGGELPETLDEVLNAIEEKLGTSLNEM